MDDVSSKDSSQNHEDRSVSITGSEAPSRTPSGSWGFRSNSFPRASFSSDSSSSSGKSGPAGWAKSLQSWGSGSKDSQSPRGGGKSGFNFFNNIGFHKQTVVKIPVVEAPLETGSAPVSPTQDNGPLNSLRTGFLNSSRSAVKAVQTRARHMVSQNKRRYQEGGFDLDLSYITENIIAMGFPAGDMSSGFFGYVEGFYRNHMEEVIKFLETQHKGKYKVYNLCSERLYDAALFEGKVGCFPFDDHNCPPLQLISAFCESAYTWLKGDLENVVVVHCKAGMARTGLMISCLLLYLKFFPTAEESILYYNQKRCIDGKGLVLPSQLRYVKYFERVLRDFEGETPKGRKCILRGIRLHRCPYWIRPAVTILDHNGVQFSSKKHPRTKDMLSEDIWFAAPRKGVMVFALPGERCIADLEGDFKVLFSDRQGDFYCWLNTNMMESRQVLLTSDLDGFDKRRLPSPGFQVEVVILDHDAPLPTKSRGQKVPEQVATTDTQGEPQSSSAQDNPASRPSPTADESQTKADGKDGDKDNIFSDSDGEDDRSGLRASAKHTSVEHDVGAAADGEAGPGVGSPNSSAFSMSSTIGDGLRSAMDRMGISPGARTSPPRPANDSMTQDVGVKPPLPGILSDSAERSNLSYAGVNEAGTAVEGQNLAPARDPPTSEQSGGQTVEPSSDVTHNVGKAVLKGDSKEPPRGEEASIFYTPAPQSDFQATVASAADASVFTFGDDEDFESDEE